MDEIEDIKSEINHINKSLSIIRIMLRELLIDRFVEYDSVTMAIRCNLCFMRKIYGKEGSYHEKDCVLYEEGDEE